MSVSPNCGEFNRGVDLFNRAHFFDAHEVLEDVWRSLPRDRPSCRHLRQHVQGLVQLAVAFHHASRDNHVGARSVLERAMRNLNGADSSFPELDFDRLRAELIPWRKYLDDVESADEKDEKKDEKKLGGREVRRHTAPALPKIVLRR
jgi:predicted metal-dependent hydrolase